MRSKYSHHGETVWACQYDGTEESVRELQAWLGETNVHRSESGSLLVTHGITYPTDWVVLEGKHLDVISNELFVKFYSPYVRLKETDDGSQ